MHQPPGVDRQERPAIRRQLFDQGMAAADAPFLVFQSCATAGFDVAVLPAGNQDGQVGLGPVFEELAVDLDRVEFFRRRLACTVALFTAAMASGKSTSSVTATSARRRGSLVSSPLLPSDCRSMAILDSSGGAKWGEFYFEMSTEFAGPACRQGAVPTVRRPAG